MQVAFVLPAAVLVGWGGGWWLGNALHQKWIEIAGVIFGLHLGAGLRDPDGDLGREEDQYGSRGPGRVQKGKQRTPAMTEESQPVHHPIEDLTMKTWTPCSSGPCTRR